MSNVYATEPATSGRVIFETTRGPIEVQLWCRECPEATRVFLQLCLDGYYDNMIFHRIIPKTLIQTGVLRYPEVASSSSSSSSSAAMDQYRSSIRADYALERRRYELHSRLRFNHRGLVAMALASTETDDDEVELQPQFFITLEEASYLDGKHVIFGKVDAPTIFNAIKIGDMDVDEATNQPTGELEHAPRIKSVKIVDNPIHTSIVPQEKVPWHVEKKQEKARKKKRKGKRDTNVLSFGDEVAEEAVGMGETGMKSSHDLLKSKTLSKTVDKGVREAIQQEPVAASNNRPDNEPGNETKKPAVPEERNESESITTQPQNKFQDEMITYEEEEPPLDSTQTDQTNGSNKQVEEKQSPPSTKREKQDKSISAVEARRAKYLTGRKSKRDREEDTMEKLFAFQSKVRGTVAAKKAKHMKKDDKENSLASRMARRSEAASQENIEDEAPTYYGQVLESDGEEDKSSSWLQTQFKCRRHMDHHAKEKVELGSDGRGMDDYKVVDEREKHRRHHKSHSKHSHKRRKERRHERPRQSDGDR